MYREKGIFHLMLMSYLGRIDEDFIGKLVLVMDSRSIDSRLLRILE